MEDCLSTISWSEPGHAETMAIKVKPVVERIRINFDTLQIRTKGAQNIYNERKKRA